ncbi:MAG: nucleotide sugar dehydrogenase [Clostridia bacterium]|nr:nucleotide sugar dehydrogenase [Clostridia bacterium]
MSEIKQALEQKIVSRQAAVVVIGMGYVGLPLAVEKAKAGFQVTGLDCDSQRVQMINEGKNYILDVSDDEMRRLVASGKLSATDSYSALVGADIIVICVPTPLTTNRDPDISFIETVADGIVRYLRPGQLITLESTTYPGTTEKVILPKLAVKGLKAGQDFFLAYSPERVDPGNRHYNTRNTPKIVGGVTPQCLDLACLFYRQTISKVIPVSSPAVAEMTKVFENTYRSVNIALVNEIMMLCDRMGIDVWEVVDAAATKPFGIQTFYPGPGVGGHCIPVDPYYLVWKAREYDFDTRLIELSGHINLQASYYVVEKVRDALNSRHKCINGAKILILGVAYKKDIDDLRESPALKIISILRRLGATIVYHDPYIPSLILEEQSTVALSSKILTQDEISASDCVLIITDHSSIDYSWVCRHAQLVVDTRNVTKDFRESREKIYRI